MVLVLGRCVLFDLVLVWALAWASEKQGGRTKVPTTTKIPVIENDSSPKCMRPMRSLRSKNLSLLHLTNFELEILQNADAGRHCLQSHGVKSIVT